MAESKQKESDDSSEEDQEVSSSAAGCLNQKPRRSRGQGSRERRKVRRALEKLQKQLAEAFGVHVPLLLPTQLDALATVQYPLQLMPAAVAAAHQLQPPQLADYGVLPAPPPVLPALVGEPLTYGPGPAAAAALPALVEEPPAPGHEFVAAPADGPALDQPQCGDQQRCQQQLQVSAVYQQQFQADAGYQQQSQQLQTGLAQPPAATAELSTEDAAMSLLVSGGLMGMGVVPTAAGSTIPTLVSSSVPRRLDGAPMAGPQRRGASGEPGAKSSHSNGGVSSEDDVGASNGSVEEHSPNKIFVGGISFQTTADRLREYFAPYGTILDVMVLRDQATNRNRGFGFVTFADEESVTKVLKGGEHILDGKKIDPKMATPKGSKAAEFTTPKKVFVGGVSQETTQQELQEYFQQFGKVLDVSLQMDNNTKRHRGFAFVTYASEEDSTKVVRKHHHVIKSKTVECKFAQPKETIQAQERSKRAQLMSAMQSAAASAMSGPLGLAAAAQAQHYGRVMSAAGGPAFSALSSFRYSPYTLPTAAAGSQQLGQLASLPQHQPAAFQGQQLQPIQLQPAAAAGAPTYQIANLDMSGLQGVDWTTAPLAYYSA